jgi:hypothetical protein
MRDGLRGSFMAETHHGKLQFGNAFLLYRYTIVVALGLAVRGISVNLGEEQQQTPGSVRG